ncbi:MAG: RNA polymerase sporulation sigma factor SigF [bacterium]|jgi:RNA polymerase sporulation-specific sigma factor|nr:RNA polymerase sporulation sigma factor SigF [Bacillota bacterium]HHW55559.1 RNA polymerase sporulation sigma factor SigF [Bacillota bacterium]
MARYMVNLNWDEPSPLPEAEVKFLLERVHQGDEEARQRLIETNLKLVRTVVQRFAPWGYEQEDLFQVGCIGLVKAIDNFDTSFGVKFSTYAVPMIIGEIRRFLRDDNPIRVSRSLKEKGFNIKRAVEKLTQRLGRGPTLQELAEETGLELEEVATALEAIQPITSLSDPLYQDEGDPILLSDQIAGVEEEPDWLNKVMLKQVLEKLPERERRLIHLRFFQDKTQTEIARLLGLSQVQVSRLEKQILKKMKRILDTNPRAT